MLDELLSHSRPMCVGRYVFDLPEAFRQGGSTVFINKNRIEMKPMPLPEFEQRIRLREQELAATKTINAVDEPYLKGTHPLSEGAKGIIFQRNSDDLVSDMFRVLEGYVYHNGVAFKTMLCAENTDTARYDCTRKKFPTNINAKLSELHNLLGRLRGVREGEPMPEGPALCFAHGYLLGDSLSVTGDIEGAEEVSTAFWIADYPRMGFTLTTNSYMQDDDSLLGRMNGISMTKLLLRFGAGVKTLSKGPRTIQGAKAEELLVYNGSYSEEKEYNYLMYIHKQSGSNQAPVLEVELNYGPIGDGTEADELTEPQLRAIWYQLTDSIRIRPGAI